MPSFEKILPVSPLAKGLSLPTKAAIFQLTNNDFYVGKWKSIVP
jgi:hypothetical protein